MPNRYPGVVERRDAAGRRRFRVRVRRSGQTQTATLPTLEAALAWRAQALSALEGTADAPERPRRVVLQEPASRAATVEEAARRLCRGMVSGTIRNRDGLEFKPSVSRKYEAALRLLVLPRIGAVPVATLTGGDVQRLVDEIAAEHTAEHARKALTALRVALRVSQRYGEVDGNPCSGVRVPTSGRAAKPARILTPEEAAAIIVAAADEDARWQRSFAAPLFALAFGTGLRLGELLALPWGPEGLDIEAAAVRVGRSVDRIRDAKSGLYPFMRPKSRSSHREVPLAPEEVARLRRHRLATGRRGGGGLVFGNDRGEPLSPIPAERAFKRAAKAAKVAEPFPRFHDTRHAFASHALAAGLTAHAVASLLGHADAGLVWRRYGHALPDELAGAGEVLSAWKAARKG